jgi:fibronectin-binding autotransporter adhesin
MKKIMWFILSLVMVAAPNAPASAFTLNFGGTTGPGGVTNQGTFSSVANTTFTTTTINFNSVVLSGGSFTNGFATYTGVTSISTNLSPSYTPGTTPTTTTGAGNTSLNLTVFGGSPVTINFAANLDYFGLDLGFADAGNQIQFYQGNTLLRTYNVTDADFFGPTIGSNQGNAYVNFFASNPSEYFNKVVLTETCCGGFETDNHAYRRVVPEPYPLAAFVGFMALGFTAKRRASLSTYQGVDKI